MPRTDTGRIARLIRVFRVAAFACSGVGILLVVARVFWGDGPPEETAAVAVMGGVLASTPFVLACAVDEFLRDGLSNARR